MEAKEAKETVEDIVAEFREMVHKSVDGIIAVKADVIADRIEAARKRECGNAAAIREVVSKWATFPVPISADGVEPEFLLDMLEEMRDDMLAALSAPSRNCDVGTAEEQEKRFQDFCDDSQTDDDFCSMCARCSLKKERHCELAWAQMPYESEAAR